MNHARVQNGVWSRRVPWKTTAGWRTDVAFTVFCRCDVQVARYEPDQGPTVEIPFEEVRMALLWAPIRLQQQKIGPYNIDPEAQTLNERAVRMVVRKPANSPKPG